MWRFFRFGVEYIFFFKQKTAYEIHQWLEFRRVLFRSPNPITITLSNVWVREKQIESTSSITPKGKRCILWKDDIGKLKLLAELLADNDYIDSPSVWSAHFSTDPLKRTNAAPIKWKKISMNLNICWDISKTSKSVNHILPTLKDWKNHIGAGKNLPKSWTLSKPSWNASIKCEFWCEFWRIKIAP